MKTITRIFRNIWLAFKRATIDPVKSVGDALSKARPMTKPEKETLRNILMLIGAIVLIRTPYLGWAGNILAFVTVMNFFILVVNFIDELAKGSLDDVVAEVDPTPAAA